jgi:hypothetical protein
VNEEDGNPIGTISDIVYRQLPVVRRIVQASLAGALNIARIHA